MSRAARIGPSQADGAQQLALVMLATFQNQVVAGLAAQLLHQVKLLVESPGAALHPALG